MLLRSIVTAVDRWRFERPLAILLGLAAAFLAIAVPPSRFTLLPGLAVFPLFQPVLAVLFGVAAGAVGYAAMRLSGRGRVAPWSVAVPVDEEVESALAAAEVSLRLRRADRHPDAPAREPIFASRDLGPPFMEAGAFAPPPADESASPPIPEGDYAEVGDEAVADAPHEETHPDSSRIESGESEPIDDASHWFVDEAVANDAQADPAEGFRPLPRPEPVAMPTPAPPMPAPEPPTPIAAFAPEEQQPPPPARTAQRASIAQRTSIAAMMERLSTGLEHRAAGATAGDGAPSRPRDRQPALREALDELNRLAARRG